MCFKEMFSGKTHVESDLVIFPPEKIVEGVLQHGLADMEALEKQFVQFL
jgi:hypothetical protein